MAISPETAHSGWRDVGGILLHAFWILLLLSLVSYHASDIYIMQSPPNQPALNLIGPVGAWLAFGVLMGLGVVGYLAPLAIGVYACFLLFKKQGWVWPKLVWLILLFLALLCLVELRPEFWQPAVRRLNIVGPGGVLGVLLGPRGLFKLLGTAGTAILAGAVLLASLVLLFEVQLLLVFRFAGEAAKRRYDRWVEGRQALRDRREQIEEEQKKLNRQRQRLERVLGAQRDTPAPAAAAAPERLPKPEKELGTTDEGEEEEPRAPVRVERPRPLPRAKPRPAPAPGAFVLPPVDLLDPIPDSRDREVPADVRGGAQLLKETLAEFDIEVDITNVEQGPVVTRYEMLPAPGVRVEKIAGLSSNIALAMKAESVRVLAPVPGKGVVGIEVPNSKTTLVYLREILEGDAWRTSRAALPLSLGKDVSGRPLLADLAEMPHLLVAGATGSGKTVCINSILTALLMSRTPEEMRLLLIDPKRVEFSAFNHVPHLVVPVITDAKKVGIGLRWAINEMETRYKMFAREGVRNIKGFNSRPAAQQEKLFEEAGAEDEEREEQPPARYPYIVIVVDELADLMLVAQAEIEDAIARLAQLSRATGIHMILATQRPSVNVITGTIKANFPARIAFQVAQKTDSRTILDAIGADKLLGKGDMLFMPPGASKLIRAQGTMTTDREIHAVVDFIKAQGQPDYESAVKEKIENKSVDLPEMGDDELLEPAIEVIRQTGRASTSLLQRRLRIGYTRAARLMDLMEEKGIVGPPKGSDPRDILIDLDGSMPSNPEQEPDA